MKTLKEMLAEARQIVPEQGPAELRKRLKGPAFKRPDHPL